MLTALFAQVGPFFNWVYMVYAIFTAGQRTWGGPRADAGKADSMTSPAAAIKRAEAAGDDLNVIPESFRPTPRPDSSYSAGGVGIGGADSAKRLSQRVPLQPDRRWEGRFRSAGRNPTWTPSYSDDNGSRTPLGLGAGSRGSRPPSAFYNSRAVQQSRLSTDSSSSLSRSDIGEPSVYMPRRVRSAVVVDEVDRARSRPSSPTFGLSFDGQSDSMYRVSAMSGLEPYQTGGPAEGSIGTLSRIDITSAGSRDKHVLNHSNHRKDRAPAASRFEAP